MAAKFFALLTNLGAAKLANAAALGTKLEISQMAVGDGGGALPIPDPAQTALKGEKRRASINLLTVDLANTNQIIAEQVIPESEGGWWIREIGLFDKDGALIAIANCPETYKPQLQEGSGRTQTIRMILIVNSTDAITLKIDPAIVLATRQYVDDKVIEVKAYADNLLSRHLSDGNPHNQYAPKASPALTGVPTAPTAEPATNTTQIATTAFVQAMALTLRDGARMDAPVGIPSPWPAATAPNGWLKCNGASFDRSKYPLLAAAYPNGVLPDMRGEFLRGFDDGRGVDGGRGLLSAQAGTWIQPNLENNNTDTGIPIGNGELPFNTGTTGAVNALTGAGTAGPRTRWFIRPRNIAFNYIVRAA